MLCSIKLGSRRSTIARAAASLSPIFSSMRLKSSKPPSELKIPAFEVHLNALATDAAKVKILVGTFGTLWHRRMTLLIELNTNNNAPSSQSADTYR